MLPGPAPALPVSGLDEALTMISADLQEGSEMNMVTQAQRKSSLRSVSENHRHSSCRAGLCSLDICTLLRFRGQGEEALLMIP